MNKFRIYQRELDKLLDAGEDAATARSIAAERAEEIYWDMVDAAKDRAKDREWDGSLTK